jgi:hypothetical protein
VCDAEIKDTEIENTQYRFKDYEDRRGDAPGCPFTSIDTMSFTDVMHMKVTDACKMYP